ncbi:MAG: hypothetical protein KJN99_10025, partial [Marinicaulis sp.]|nr:hypothetical protein [Marinicaulis sp.]
MADETKSNDDEKPDNAVPEVEAEIVEDERTANDDDALGDLHKDAEPAETNKNTKVFGLSPGVILLGIFIFIVGAAVLTWRNLANNQPRVVEEAAQDAPPGAIIEMPAIDDVDEPVELPALGEAEIEESPDSGQADDAASLPAMDEDAEDKLANTVAEDISPEAVGVIAGDNLETALEDGEVLLPPLPDAEAEVGGNKSFVADAKSALDEIDETESEPESGFTLSEDAAQDGANDVDTEVQSPTGSE